MYSRPIASIKKLFDVYVMWTDFSCPLSESKYFTCPLPFHDFQTWKIKCHETSIGPSSGHKKEGKVQNLQAGGQRFVLFDV